MGAALDNHSFKVVREKGANSQLFRWGDQLTSEDNTLTLKVVSDCKPAEAWSDHLAPVAEGGGVFAQGCRVEVAGANKLGKQLGKQICGTDPDFVVIAPLVWQSTGDAQEHWGFASSTDLVSASCGVEGKFTEPAARAHWAEPWTGALAKCAMLWHMNKSAELLTSCVHMARAAYEGRNVDHTYPGTPVDAFDIRKDEPVATSHAHGCAITKKLLAELPSQDVPRLLIERKQLVQKMCSMWVEAEWDEKGAVCISHARYENLKAKNPGIAAIFDVPVNRAGASIVHCRHDAVPKTRSIEAWSVQGATTRLVNRSVHKLNLTEAAQFPPDPDPSWRTARDDNACVDLCANFDKASMSSR